MTFGPFDVSAGSKGFVPLFQGSGIRVPLCPTGNQNPAMVEPLQPMPQHWAVILLKDLSPHLDHEVWPNADEVPIERCMV
jgi:hypothetical protein